MEDESFKADKGEERTRRMMAGKGLRGWLEKGRRGRGKDTENDSRVVFARVAWTGETWKFS